MNLCLVGAGGHARVVAEIARHAGHCIVAYSDPRNASWLSVQHLQTDEDADELPSDVGIAIGLGGVSPAALERRHALYRRFKKVGRRMPALIHPGAIVASGISLGDGSLIMAGAVIQVEARIGAAVIVNTRAVVEHEATIEDGAHLAPGSVVLGGAHIGATAMIGANAVVLPGARVPAGGLVKAGGVWTG